MSGSAYARKNFNKWMNTFTKLAPVEFSSVFEDNDNSGFLILNMGCNAMCPFMAKHFLLEANCMTLTEGRMLFYHTDLPFFLIHAPLLDAPANIEVEVSYNGVSMKVYLLPIPQQRNSGTSNQGSPFMALVRCRFASVLLHVTIPFQSEVIQIPESIPSETLPGDPREVTSTEIQQVPGLFCIPDFLTVEEHDSIFSSLTNGIQGGTLSPEQLARRSVIHFNRRFIYGVNRLGPVGVEVGETPAFYDWMQSRIQNTDDEKVVITGEYPIEKGSFACDQLTVNIYDYSKTRVSGIAPHVDAHSPFEDFICIVSLGSGTVMEFCPDGVPVGDARGGRETVSVYMAPRSLVVMSGEVRYAWTHCIAERKTDILSERVPKLTRGLRLSLTWRRGRSGYHRKKECPYPLLCDGEE